MSAFEQVDPNQGAQDRYDVLAADDDPAIRRMLGEWFELEGISAKIVSSGIEAQQHVGDSEIVLTDLEMPMGGGDVVAAHMHATQEEGHDPGDLILMTASSVRAGRLRAGEEDLGHELLAVWDKPFDMNDLLAAIRQRLEQRRQQRDAEA